MSYAFCSEFRGFGALNEAEAAAVIQHLVEVLAAVDLVYLRTHPSTPTLYESGVYYCRDKRGSERQWWDIPRVLKEGCADCKALAAWRVAELRSAGYAAFPKVVTTDGQLYHVIVQSNHTIEDPSAILGMHS